MTFRLSTLEFFLLRHPPNHIHKPRVVITSCQLDRDKGHKDMFYALKKVREQGVDFRCIVVGTGPDEQLVKEQCSSMGLDDITTFTGHVSCSGTTGKGRYLCAPSYCEALGIALEEAMAQGLACIARRSGGVPEIWPTDQGSLLVLAHDDGSNMAEALYSLLTLPGEAFA